MPENWFGKNIRGDKNMCPGARTNGISLIHGNHASFSPDVDVLFGNVFQFMTDYDMKDGDLAEDVKALRNILILRVANRTETARDCSDVLGIEDMVVKRLENIVRQRQVGLSN